MASTRRDFLKTGAMGVSLSFLAPQFITRAAYGADLTPGKILVVLQLAGGNDTVNTFIPYADSKYRSLRPNLGIADASIIKVDSRMGFHPSMSALQPLYANRRFAFINNVGFSTLDRSHFRCQDVWQTGDDSYGQVQRGVTGWLGRYGDVYLSEDPSALTEVSISSTNPEGMTANKVLPAAVADTATFDITTDARYPADRDVYVTTLRTIYGYAQADGTREDVRTQGAETFNAIDLLKTIPPASTTVTYPASALGKAFKLAAQIAAGNVGTHAIWIKAGGFDTHSQQVDTHANLWQDVSESLAAFDSDISGRGVADRVMVMGWSEFGRRVQENASLGTDHGKAGTVFLLGQQVKGGTFYGDAPDLGNLDEGDLRTAIDFRSIYSTIITDWFGKDPQPVLNGTYANLGFVDKQSSIFHLRNRR